MREKTETDQATSVRHSDHDLLDSLSLRLLQHLRHGRHHPFASLEPIPLDARKALGKEPVEGFGFGKELPVSELLVRRERGGVGGLEEVLEEVAFGEVGKVRKLLEGEREKKCKKGEEKG
jgi:hypothetical protein